MKIKVGTAPDSWGVWFPSDAAQPPWQRVLDEVAACGYQWIELGPYGYLPTELPVLRSEFERRGLRATASFVMIHLEDPQIWPALEKQVLGFGELLAGMGAPYLVLIDDVYSDLSGKLLAPRTLDDTAWSRLIDNTHKVSELARRKLGLQMVFHPHAETHVEYEDQIERFLEQTDPATVPLCLDTGHHAYRGGDPVRFLRKHHDRIRYLHLKNVDRNVQRKVEAEKIAFSTAVGMDMFCEPSGGAVDFLAFRDALQDVGYEGWATVEQDMYPAPHDKPMPIAKRTLEYFRQVGLAE
jgi:inosose dehydratase